MPYQQENVKYARKLRKEMTPWERKLWYLFLTGYPVRFQRQKPIGQYIVDFYCAASKLAVELDGGGHYQPEAEEKDKIRTAQINRYGIEVLRFSNRDVDLNFDGVCMVIDQAVKERYRR